MDDGTATDWERTAYIAEQRSPSSTTTTIASAAAESAPHHWTAAASLQFPPAAARRIAYFVAYALAVLCATTPHRLPSAVPRMLRVFILRGQRSASRPPGALPW